MVYIKLDEEWQEKIQEQDISGTGFDLVVVKMENGENYSAELHNAKKLRMMQDIKVERIDEINVL